MKCMYVLCVYLVDHVLIFQEVQYKLVLFTCIGAVFWSLHGTYEPYDTGKYFRFDRLVGAGLRVRSLMLFLVSCLLAAQGNRGHPEWPRGEVRSRK